MEDILLLFAAGENWPGVEDERVVFSQGSGLRAS